MQQKNRPFELADVHMQSRQLAGSLLTLLLGSGRGLRGHRIAGGGQPQSGRAGEFVLGPGPAHGRR